MVFAMHQIKVITSPATSTSAPWFEEYLRELATEQRLIASVTSEVGTGGDMGRSIAAATPTADGQLQLREAGADGQLRRHADDLLVTLRRTPGRRAERPGDGRRHAATRTSSSRPAPGIRSGMRGTCSPGFVVRGRVLA